MLASTRMQAPQRQRTPFRYGTRQRWAPVGSVAYASGGRFSFELPRVGFLASVMLRLSGTMTLSAAGTLTTRGPWDLVNRLTLRVNVGAATLYDSTGFGNFVVQRMLTRGFDPTASADADVYAAPTASGGNAWALTYWIPVAENFGRQFDLGLVNLQAPEIQVNMDGVFGAPADVVSNATSFAGTLACGYLYYEVPDPQAVQYPPLVFHRIIESRQTISAVGDQIFTAPREGMLLRLAHVVQQNDARTNNVSRLVIRFNKTDEIYRYERAELKWLQHYLYGSPLPTGVFVHEWWAAEGYPGEGDNRDNVSSEELSTLESIVTTTGTLGGTLNALDSIREFTQIVAL